MKSGKGKKLSIESAEELIAKYGDDGIPNEVLEEILGKKFVEDFEKEFQKLLEDLESCRMKPLPLDIVNPSKWGREKS